MYRQRQIILRQRWQYLLQRQPINLFVQLITNVTYLKAILDMASLLGRGGKDGKKAVASYLTECYKIVSHFARWSKPLYCLAGGKMESLGGAILASSSLPVIRYNATLSFPEASMLKYKV